MINQANIIGKLNITRLDNNAQYFLVSENEYVHLTFNEKQLLELQDDLPEYIAAKCTLLPDEYGGIGCHVEQYMTVPGPSDPNSEFGMNHATLIGVPSFYDNDGLLDVSLDNEYSLTVLLTDNLKEAYEEHIDKNIRAIGVKGTLMFDKELNSNIFEAYSLSILGISLDLSPQNEMEMN